MSKPLQVVVAIDSFKGSITSADAAKAVAAGIHRAQPGALVRQVPIADGGEGTVIALTTALGGQVFTQPVTGPLGQAVVATWGLLDAHTAVIEMAQASGLHLTAATPEAAMRATTQGVGELIEAAVDHGATKIYVGLGGSATTDGGVGMAQALGVKFITARGTPVAPGAGGLSTITHIDLQGLDPRLAKTQIVILSDVVNPLTGPNGAATIYGPQKGLTAAQIPDVDAGLAQLGDFMFQLTGRRIAQTPGAGAAGGLGAGLLAFTHATMAQGITTILQLVGLDQALAQADLVITGEGHMDSQSLNGKAPIGVAQAAKRYGLPVIALVGARSAKLDAVYAAGIDAVWPITNGPQSLAVAMHQVRTNLTMAAESAMRTFLISSATQKEQA